jgi:uridine kinase
MNAEIKKVVKRSGAVVPFNRERITNAIYRAAVAVGGRDRETAESLADQVVELLKETYGNNTYPTVEEIQDLVEYVLIENGHARTAKAYILYRQERARRRRRREAGKSQRDPENIPYKKLWEILNWSVDHDVYNIYRLNERVAKGQFAEIVQESDAAYEKDIATAANRIQKRRSELRIVIIAGPSSSGKTTTTAKLSQRLQDSGLSLVSLNVDNYFHNLEMHPRDEHGDYDYETPRALDLELINKHLNQLLAGKEVKIPYYDFQTGTREDAVTPMQVGTDDVILIDSLHGLYPKMTEAIPEQKKFKLYVETLLQMKGPDNKYIRFTDLRLMRRMVRDARERAYTPEQTLEHWHYVRSSELRNIIPYVNTADHVLNGALPYELPIMRAHLFADFIQWVQKYKDDPLHTDAYLRAERIYRLLQITLPVENETSIPKTSLLREFIGGSAYDLH